MNLVDKDDILKNIADLQKSPWFNDGEDTESGRRLQYNVRKEAVEIVRDICVKVAPTIDAIPVEWAQNLHKNYIMTRDDIEIRDWMLMRWHKEQEAR